MLRQSPALDEIKRRYAREHLAGLTYREALAIFTALWREARALNPDFPGDGKRSLAADLAIARAVNGLPPSA
jgi:hypothetical protein